MKKSQIKELIKEKYKSMQSISEKEEIEDLETVDSTEDVTGDGSEIPSTGGESSIIDDALDAAIEAAVDYGDPKLSTLLNNAKIYLARSLSRNV